MKKLSKFTIMKKIRLLLAVIFASFLITTQVSALSNSIVLKTDKSDLEAGEEITVSVDLPEDSEIYALTATLQYDQNVFEQINDTNFTLPESASVRYNQENDQFGIINQTGDIDGLLKVRLKVKDDAKVGDTNIALTNISSSDGDKKVEYSTASTKVLVTRDVADGEVVETGQENVIAEGTEETENVFFTLPFVLIALIMVGIILYSMPLWLTFMGCSPLSAMMSRTWTSGNISHSFRPKSLR